MVMPSQGCGSANGGLPKELTRGNESAGGGALTIDSGPCVDGLRHSVAKIWSKAEELFFQNWIVHTSCGDGLGTGELLVKLDAEFVPGALGSGIDHRVAVEVVHGISVYGKPRESGADQGTACRFTSSMGVGSSSLWRVG